MVLSTQERRWPTTRACSRATPPSSRRSTRTSSSTSPASSATPETFEALKAERLPGDRSRPRPRARRCAIWVPGCSTGQEAYSLAIALLEFLDEQPVRRSRSRSSPPTSATPARCARRAPGSTPTSIEADVSPERLRRFFTQEDGTYRDQQVDPRPVRLRPAERGGRSAVLAHGPDQLPQPADLPRRRRCQKRVIPTFHYALNPDGFLLLGAAGDGRRVLRPVRAGGPPAPHLRQEGDGGAAVPALPGRQASRRRRGRAAPAPPAGPSADWQREADRVVLGRYAPAGRAGRRRPGDRCSSAARPARTWRRRRGTPSFNLLQDGPRGAVPGAAQRPRRGRQANAPAAAAASGSAATGSVREIDLRVLPVRLPGAGERCFLVLFEDVRPPGGGGPRRERPGRPPAGGGPGDSPAAAPAGRPRRRPPAAPADARRAPRPATRDRPAAPGAGCDRASTCSR